MKYYLYISSAKLDMLFNQIPGDLKRKVAAELKIDLKILSATFKQEAVSETLISKLDLVIEAITVSGEVGDLSNPKQYFAGKLDMGWGPIGLDYFGDDPKKHEMVMFVGSPDGRRMVGLVGSTAHMLGEVGVPVHAYYSRPEVFREIADGLRELQSEETYERELLSVKEVASLGAQSWKRYTQYVEFVAKTFLFDGEILVGSPLYVALASKSEDDVPPQKNSKKAWWSL